jgi:hypothetical protein
MRADSLPLARACIWYQIAPKVMEQSIAEMNPIIMVIVISPEYACCQSNYYRTASFRELSEEIQYIAMY